MISTLTVTQVDPNRAKVKRDGGTYQCFYIMGTKQDGSVSEQTVATSFLNNNAVLLNQLNAVEVGKVFDFHLEKNGQFWNLTGVTPSGDIPTKAAPAAQKATAPLDNKSKYVDNSIGMQVGNALNNAATLLAAKVVKGTVETVAEDILRIGERLKKNLVAGKYANNQPAPKVEDIYEDESNPFGD